MNYIVFSNDIKFEIDSRSTENNLIFDFKKISDFTDFLNSINLTKIPKISILAGKTVVAEYKNKRVKKINIEDGEGIEVTVMLENIPDIELKIEKIAERVDIQDKAIEDISVVAAEIVESVGIEKKVEEIIL